MVKQYIDSVGAYTEQYLKVIESFKDYKFSVLLQTINDAVLNAINSPKFNPRVARFFANKNKEGVPFTDFTEEPDSVTQIKKLLNALYHGRLAFLDLETINVRSWKESPANFALVYQNTVKHAYEACYLITHPDMDFRGIFADEYELILPLLDQFTEFAKNIEIHPETVPEVLKESTLSYTAGLISGVAVDQMQPTTNGDLDYDFLAQFGAVLPKYLEDFTLELKKYSAAIINNESKLNKEKLQELQNAAYTLLSNLDDLKTSSLFYPVKILNYVHIIRNLITLSMSTLEGFGNLSESTQDLIRSKLAEVKYEVLPTLFGLIDKIEDNALLNPGTLSKPLMTAIKPWYQWLIEYASKPVDFMAKGEELLTIEDPKFITLRLERTYKRIDEAKKRLFKIHLANDAFDEFFDILEKSIRTDNTLRALPQDKKAQLIHLYKLLKPYMNQIDVDLNKVIIESLHTQETWKNYFGKQALWLAQQTPADQVSRILAKKEELRKIINKAINSQKFHIDLDQDLINSVHRNAHLAIFPYNGDHVFDVDEKGVLDISPELAKELETALEAKSPDLAKIAKISVEQLVDLAEYYRNKQRKLETARDAYFELMEIVGSFLQKSKKKYGEDYTCSLIDFFNTLKAKDVVKCRNLYHVIQPYILSGVSPQEKEQAVLFDKCLSHFFAGKMTTEVSPPVEWLDTLYTGSFADKFSDIDTQWLDRSNLFKNLAKIKYLADTEQMPLENDKEITERPHHILHHTHYSKFVKEFRANLFNLTEFLNDSMRAQITPQANDLPFPELEELNATLAQPQQVITIKRIFNNLFYIEGVALELEKLTHKQYQSEYVYHLLIAYGHINELVKSVRALVADPHFNLIARELLDKAVHLQGVFNEHIEPYKVGPEYVGNDGGVEHNSLWYVLNAFYIAPKHIRTLRNNNSTTTEELDELQLEAKKSTKRIEAIINSSDSYFQLFLQTPNMYKLYNSLTNKLNEFTSTSHDAVINNLDQLQTDVFIPMLLEADHWEKQLGFKPGSISGVLKKITDEYFKGLLSPLGLKSQTHIQLICDFAPFAARKAAINLEMEKASAPLNELKEKQQFFSHCYDSLKRYLELKNNPNAADEIKGLEQEIIAQYYKARPLLVQLGNKYTIEPSTDKSILDLDKLLNDSLKGHYPARQHILAQVQAAAYHYQGLVATQEMTVDSFKEQIVYLTQLEEAQIKENALFVEQYTEQALTKQINAFCNRHIGLQYTYKEYRNELRAYLLGFKSTLIQEAKQAEEINQTITDLLKDKIQEFERNNFKKYYQLDTVKAALANFNIYLSKARLAIRNNDSLFENNKTLDKKTKLINRLDLIADRGLVSINEHIALLRNAKNKDAELIKELIVLSNSSGQMTLEDLIDEVNNSTESPEIKLQRKTKLMQLEDKIKLNVQERVEFIKGKIQPDEFKGTILAHAQPDILSFTFLKKCILALLEALNLYTPTRIKLLNQISLAVNNPPQISELTNRYGLFSANVSPVIKEYQVPALPAPSV